MVELFFRKKNKLELKPNLVYRLYIFNQGHSYDTLSFVIV